MLHFISLVVLPYVLYIQTTLRKTFFAVLVQFNLGCEKL